MKPIIYFKIILLFLTCWANADSSSKSQRINELEVLNDCLASFGGYNAENSRRLWRFTEWSPDYEEFPCFTNCYLQRMWNIYNESLGYDETNVIRKFSKALYNLCESSLRQQGDKCMDAYKGLHCLATNENKILNYVESIADISSHTKVAMMQCLKYYNENYAPRLLDYSKFPVVEPIPCFTRCLVEKLDLFDRHTKKWNLNALQKELNIPRQNASLDSCYSLGNYRKRNTCIWLYRELTCFSLAK